jgi:uncharacterized protein YbjT (DUF2867 family)
MATAPTYLVTGAGGGIAGISPQVVARLRDRGESVRAMVHHDDSRADALRALGAAVIAGDLTNPVDVAAALDGVTRMFFNMSVSPDYLEATTVVCAIAKELNKLEVLVNMSQMTVSQMSATSTEESKQQRLHWLAEHVINWSAIPAVHIRPTVLLENPLFAMLAVQSIRETGQLALPFGTGRTSPVASSDVAEVVTAVLRTPKDHVGAIYELTGPATLDIDEIAEQYSQALGRPVTAVRPSYDEFLRRLDKVGLPPHVQQHIATMAKLHPEDRYNRSTDDFEDITGHPAQSVRHYVEQHRELFGADTPH